MRSPRPGRRLRLLASVALLTLVGVSPANAGNTEVSFTIHPGPLHLASDGLVSDQRGGDGGWVASEFSRTDVRTVSVL